MNNSSSARLAAELRPWIASAPAGARLPSTRALVRDHGVSAATVNAALAQLSSEGLVHTRPGDGSYVAASRPRRGADLSWQTSALGAAPTALPDLRSPLIEPAPGEIDLSGAYPHPDLLPSQAVRRALSRASRSDHALHRAPTAGLPDLRSWFAADLASRTPHGTPAHSGRDVVVLPGSQAGLAAIFRAVVGPGRPLLIESPTYWGARLAAAQAGVRLVPVASGPDGPDPADVERALASTGARAFYAQPSFANPHGGLWPLATRRAVVQAAQRHGCFLVEDEWAADFALDPAPPPLAGMDERGAVIVLRSLTKSVSPALRVAAVTARGPVLARILAEVQAQAMYVSPVLQAALLDVVSSPGWASHRRATAAALRERRDALAGSLAAQAPDLTLTSLPRGGLSLWAELPPGRGEAEVTAACAARGLHVFPGRGTFPAEPTGEFLRLNYAAAPAGDLPRAAELLGEVLAAGA